MNTPDPPDEPTASFPAGDGPGPEPAPAGGTPIPARFRPVSLHKVGGMGRVHRATDAELNREVAFKDIKPEYADRESARRRFLFEAEVTGRLEHPGVIPVYGLGRDDAGRPYYAMRFIAGQSLQEALQQFHGPDGPAGAERVLALRRLLARFVAVCQTVEYAHSRGVIHRDLKPSNVMLGPFGETLVVDWGIAKRVRAAAGEQESAPEMSGEDETAAPNAPTRSERGSKLGTPAYWSPEQAAGRPDRHDERTDVYGLGAVLFEILTGGPPHPDGYPTAEPPSPRAARAGVDRELDAITRRAMAFGQGDRFPSPAALAAEVERWLAEQPVAGQRAAVAALAVRAGNDTDDLALAEQLARQRANLGLMLNGMGRDAEAAAELAAAAGMFARLAGQRAEPRLLAEEANCHLALARSLAAAGKPDEAAAAEKTAAEIYRRLIAVRPDEYRANYATIMLTWSGPPPAAGPPGEESFPPVPPPAGSTRPTDTRTPPPDDRTGDSHPTLPGPELPRPPGDGGADLADGYTPIQELGRGGMGRVLLARDNALNRMVAIKVVEDGGRPDVRDRFLRELRITAALDHPNIVKVYTYGRRSGSGRPFIVMEYLAGEDLNHKRARLGPGWTAALLDPLAQACDGLHHAHARGVVHRDPKLSNILVLPSGRAVLFDWGLAKVVGAPADAEPGVAPLAPDDVEITRTGSIMGTPAFMAPEQLGGKPVTPAADVFAVGAGLFHLAAGRPALNPTGGLHHVLQQLIEGRIPRLREVRPDAPAALDAICAKAMAFRPEDRYPTAAALAADIRAFLAGRPASVRPRRGLWGWLTGQ